MPKLTKEKFQWDGSYLTERTTFPTPIEMYLHYDTTKDYFYFEAKEYEPYLINKKASLDFRLCKSKKQAMDLLGSAINKQADKKRFLRVQLGVEGNIGLDKEMLSKHLQEMTTYGGSYYSNVSGDEQRQFSIEIERIIRVGLEGHYIFAKCDEKWQYEKSNRLVFSTWSGNLIEWDEETEIFLLSIQEGVDRLCRLVTDFFNTKNVEELKNKIRETPNLLTQGKDNISE
jgi:hypothetical protein